MFRSLLFVALLATAAAAAPTKPNLVMVLTDDQDVLLGSMQAMPKVKKLIVEQGVNFTNAFIATPICCPSRSSYVSGMYQHNHKCYQNGVNDGPGRDETKGGCSSPYFQAAGGPESQSPAAVLKKAGYVTQYAGKYLNQYGTPNGGNVTHVPVGWDSWLGLVGNSRYYGYSVSRNGTSEPHGHDYNNDYFTDLIKNETLRFLDAHMAGPKPFFVWAATPACHGPNDPAPQYQDSFATPGTAPRTPNWNTGQVGKNEFNSLTYHPAMNVSAVAYSDITYRRRLEVLKSVDDLVEEVIDKLTAGGVLEKTVFLYTSDHGYHLGQFAMIYDKRTPYEHDVRIPFYVRLPKDLMTQDQMALVGSTSDAIVSNVDVAPSLAQLGGGQILSGYDGHSWATLLGIAGLATDGRSTAAKGRRTDTLIEYWGQTSNPTMTPPGFSVPPLWKGPHAVKWWQDRVENTWSCVRMPPMAGEKGDAIFCQWFMNWPDKANNTVAFEEYYNIADDPYQMSNGMGNVKKMPPATLAALRARLLALRNCVGNKDCNAPARVPM